MSSRLFETQMRFLNGLRELLELPGRSILCLFET